MDDMFETDFSFLSGLQVEEVKTDKPVVRRSGGKIREVAGLTYQVQGSWAGKKRPEFTEEHRDKIAAARAKQEITPETCAKISQALKGRVPVGNKAAHIARSRRVMTPYGEFPSIAQAMKALKQDVVKRIKSGYPGYYFIEKEAK